MSLKRYIAEVMQQPNVDAVVGWGRGMGHKGHMLLARAVIVQAEQLKATPFFFVSETMGKDDPLTPDEKLFIYKKVFPQQAGIFHTGNTLASVLTSVGQQYKNVILVLGEDQVQPFQWLLKPDKSGSIPYQSYGLESLQIISRQQVNDPAQSEEGPRATPMREILKNPNATEEEQFAYWREAMPDALSDAEVLEFMNRAKSRLPAPKKVKEPKQKAAKKIKDKALKESVVDIVRKAKPLLKEASLEKKLQFVKLMKVALKEGFDERMALIRKLVSTGKYDASDLELASDEELQQLLADENQADLEEGFSLDSITKFANIIPSFAEKLVKAGVQETKETWDMLKILQLKLQGKATAEQVQWMNKQWKDLAIIALGVGAIGYGAAAGAAHGAAGVVSHGAKDAILHGLADIGLEAAAEVLATKFGIDIVKKLTHNITTSTGQEHEHEQETSPIHQGVNPSVAKKKQSDLEKSFRQATTGFGGWSEGTVKKQGVSGSTDYVDEK